MGKPTSCNDPTCDSTHPKGCVGHVEDCTVCGWRGRNYVGEPCRKCGGQVQRRPCTQHCRKGQDVCNSHGGNAGRAIANAARRLEEADVHRRMGELLAEHHIDPATVDANEALLQILTDSLRMRYVLQLLVAELAPYGTPAYIEYPISDDESGVKVGQPTYRPAEPAGIYGPDHKGDGKPHVLMVMLADWSDRAARQAKLAVDAGIDERRVRVAEAQAEQLATVVRSLTGGFVEAVRALVDDATVVRQLNDMLPGIVRTAIETSGVIDVVPVEDGGS